MHETPFGNKPREAIDNGNCKTSRSCSNHSMFTSRRPTSTSPQGDSPHLGKGGSTDATECTPRWRNSTPLQHPKHRNLETAQRQRPAWYWPGPGGESSSSGESCTRMSQFHLSISRPGSPAKHADNGRESQVNKTLLAIHSSRVANLEVPLQSVDEGHKLWKPLLERGVIKEIKNEGDIFDQWRSRSRRGLGSIGRTTRYRSR